MRETVESHARIIEAIARFDSTYSEMDHPKGSAAATLSQIIDARKHFQGFGETGEFTLARREENKIVFLLSHRHHDFDNPQPVPFDSDIAEPMRRALSGKSGTLIGLDYRGEIVLAAFEPVKILGYGIVVKIDLSEIRKPFIEASVVVGGVSFILILVGAFLFFRVSEPVLKELEEKNTQLQKEILVRKQKEEQIKISLAELQEALENIRALKGLLPICASCKKIRDDKGYWTQIESYIEKHSEALFSHSVCPVCAEKLYSDTKWYKKMKHTIK